MACILPHSHPYPRERHMPGALSTLNRHLGVCSSIICEQLRRTLSLGSNIEDYTMNYSETEMYILNELDLEKARKSWHGPPLSDASMRFLLEYPVWAELPPSQPYTLGKVAFKVILTDRDDGRRHFLGHLAHFFLCGYSEPEEMQQAAEEFYHPSRFLPDLFRTTVHSRLGLGSESWTLWLILGKFYPCIRIADDQALIEALEYLHKEYLKKHPWKHHIICFLVEIDSPETRNRFTRLQPPQREPYRDPDDQTPRPSYAPEYHPDGSQESNHTEFTPDTSAGNGEQDGEGEYSDFWDEDEDEENREDDSDGMSIAAIPESEAPHDYTKLLSMPERLSLGFEPRSAEPVRIESVKVPGVLETIDTDTKKGTDVLDGDLDSVLPETGTPSDAEWAMCCSFLSLNPDEHKDPTQKSVHIPNTDIDLTPRQYRAAFSMLHCRGSRGLYGGVLADVPGTGKTHTCVALVLFRALVCYNMAEVKKEWETREYEASKGKVSRTREFTHLSRDASDHDKCPCGNAQGILCYAHSRGVTRDIGDTLSRGPSLILAPQGVIEEWKTVFRRATINRRFFEPCLIHTTSPRELACPPDFEKRFQVTARPRQDDFPKDYQPDVMDMDFSYTIDADQGKQPERFIILSTHQIEKLKEQFQIPVMVSTGGKKVRMTVYGLPAGCQIVDEFHKVRLMTNPVVKLAEEHKRIKRYQTDFWSVSGTIMPTSSFTDLASTVAILQRPPWTQPGHRYYKSRLECVEELERAYFEAVSARGSQAAVDEFKQRARQFFDGWIIRHTMESRFFDQRITTMKEMQPIKKTFVTPPEYLGHVQTLADQVDARIREITQSTSNEQVVRSLPTYKELTPLQVASTFPGAAALILQDKIKVDAPALRDVIKKAKGDVANVQEFADHTDAIISGSAKLEQIVLLFLRMEEDYQSRPKPDIFSSENLRENRQLKKMVIVTPTLGEAIFMYLGLKKRLSSIKGAKPVLLHADLLSSEKQRMISDFQALTPNTPRVLVTPFDVGGTGLNLQTANYQILTGPLRTKDYELQAFARTNREGNLLRLHHWLFLTDDNPADRLIIARQANRRLASNPFDICVKFEVEEEDGENESSDGAHDG